jgi:hypothetical protein
VRCRWRKKKRKRETQRARARNNKKREIQKKQRERPPEPRKKREKRLYNIITLACGLQKRSHQIWSNTPNIARRYQSKTHLLLFYVCVRVCFVVLLWEGNRFFFVAYFFVFFVFWLKFSLTFPSFCVVLHFLVTVVFFIIIGNEKTLLRREREIYIKRDLRGSSFTRGAKRGY